MRYIEQYIHEDLKQKMVFIGGPRQVGKTTLAQNVLNNNYSMDGQYYNWDYEKDKKSILDMQWMEKDRLLIFDELHKYPKWKNWLKGLYDVEKDKHHFLITGSARLDTYKKGGDSMLGRYFYWRLHPFTLDEYPASIKPEDAFNRLMTIGGFPKVFIKADERFSRRWRQQRLDKILKEDLRDLAIIKEIQLLILFVNLLKSRVGGIVQLSNLANDLQISPKTAKAWLELIEMMYLVFSVKPHTVNIPRAIQKPPKIYFYDNADVIGDEGAIFENLVATSLMKRVDFYQDRDGYHYELKYIRDKEGREVDFVILKDNQVEELIEVKFKDNNISKSLQYYADKLKAPKATQIVSSISHPYQKGQVQVIDAISYFSGFK